MAKNKFDYIQDHIQHLESHYAKRDDNLKELQEIYLLDWDEETDVEEDMTSAMITKSPDGRTKVLGAIRLMTAADPQWSLNEDLNTPDTMEMSADIERWAKRMWKASGMVTEDPPHYDEVLSLLLWSEAHIVINKTEDLVNNAKSEAQENRMKEIAAMTPYTFEVVHPYGGYPEMDNYGLSAYYRTREMTMIDFMGEFGEGNVKKWLKKKSSFHDFDPDNLYKEIVLRQYWDYKNRYIWLEGMNDFLHVEDIGPVMPIVVQRGEGSSIFDKPEEQMQPFLYTMWKSGLWNRANLALTVMYTLLFQLGSAPLFVEQLGQQGERTKVEAQGPSRKAVVPPGGDYGVADLSNIITDALPQLHELAERKNEESTIYSQTLGEPLGANAPFSMVALLHQAGRLPLTATQRKGSFGIARAMKKALTWLKNERPSEYNYEHIFGDSDDFAERLKELPDHYVLEARLGLDLPEDMGEKIRMAREMAESDDPLASKHWVRENLLDMDDPKMEQKRIWSEQASTNKFMEYVTRRMEQAIRQEEQQKIAQAMQQAQAQQSPQGRQLRGRGGGQQRPQGQRRPVENREPRRPRPAKRGQ